MIVPVPNETLQIRTCNEMNSRKPKPSKVLIFATLTVEERVLITMIKLIGLPAEKFEEIMESWQQWAGDKISTGPEGLEPSTNCSAGSHSIQAELWARITSILQP